MEERITDIPDECWGMIFSRVDQNIDCESISLVCKRFLSITNALRVSLNVLFPSIQILSNLLRRFSRLKNIELTGFKGNLKQAILLIARSGLDLQELDLSCNRSLPEDSLEELGSNMRNLTVLKCAGSLSTDSDLVRIGTCFPELEELDISHSRFPHVENDGRIVAVTDEGVSFVSMALTKLRKIDLSMNKYISDISLVSLSSNCAFLEKIEVRYCGVTEKGISYILQNTHHLNSLIVSAHFKLESFSVVGSASFYKNLQSLCFSSVHVSDESLDSITRANIPLREFKLVFCKGYTFTGLSPLLQSYQTLNCLLLYGAEFLTDKHIEYVSAFLTNLTSVYLYTCPELSESAFVMLVQRCPFLTHIQMGETRIGREEYEYECLNKNFAIKSLSLRSNRHLKSYGLTKLLSICPNIEKLDLTDKHIEYVSAFLTNLTSVYLYTCPELSESAFVMLVQRCPFLTHIQMGETRIGREEYEYECLNKNFAIKSLSLRSNRHLKSYGLTKLLSICPNIEKLDLGNSFDREEHLDIADILGNYGIKSLVLHQCRLKFSRINGQVSKLQRFAASYSLIGDEELRMIGENCPNLMHLDLEDCEKVTQKGVKQVVISCKRLRFLNLSGCSNVESDITTTWIVSNSPSLRRFTTPAHLYPKWFQQGGCLVSKGVDDDELG